MSNVKPSDFSREQLQKIHDDSIAEFSRCAGVEVDPRLQPWSLDETIKFVCLFSACNSVGPKWP